MRVHLCGPLRIEQTDRLVEGTLPGRQGRLLFAYLVLERRRGVSRDELASLLWPDAPPPSAATTLRALLSKLRATLGPGVINGTTALRACLPSGAWVDVEAAAEAAARGERAIVEGAWHEGRSAAQEALALTSQRFLPGDDGEWIEERRRELDEMRIGSLEQLARVALELGGSDLLAAERHARAIVDAAPYRESGYLLLMRVLAAQGNVAEALRVYHGARTRLLDELGVPPAPELRALSERLLTLHEGDPEAQPAERDSARLPPLLARPERTPLIGRDEQLERLLDLLDAAPDSEPRAAVLRGEAGIGKTRLITELARRLHRHGATVLYGAALRDAPTPFQPFLEALGEYVRHASSSDRSRFLAIDPPVVSRLLPELGDAKAQATPHEMQSGRPRALSALTRILEMLTSRSPLLVALDDMHWADPASTQLLAHLIRTAQAPLRVLVAYRPDEVPPELTGTLSEVKRRTPVEQIELTALTQDQVDLLIAAWAGSGAPERFAQDIHRRTEGNPFFVGHVLRHLIRSGAIDPEVRRWASAADIWSLGVPHEVQELIELRLARFDRRERQALGAAAVVGQDFSLALVERAIGDTRGVTLDAVDAALTAGLLQEHEERPGSFRFAHALVREAIYSQLSSARRGRLHRAVGEAIGALHADALEPHTEQLALHFVAAARSGEDALAAIESSLAAADHARSLFANEQAESHYLVALELLERRPDRDFRARALEGLGDMLAFRARGAEAADAFGEALLDLPADRAIERARLERKRGQSLQRDRDAAAATQAFERAELELRRTQARDHAFAEETIELGLDRLTLLYWEGDTSVMGQVIDRLDPLVATHGTPAQRTRLLHSSLVREIRQRRCQLSGETVDLAVRALTAAGGTGDPVMLAHAHFQVGFALLWADRADEAVGQLQRAVDLSRRAGEMMREARALTYIAVAHRHRGSAAEAEASALRALDASTAAAMPECRALNHSNLAWSATRAGRMESAREHAQAGLTLMADFPFRMPIYPSLTLWPAVAVALADGDLRKAVERAGQLLDPQLRPLREPVRRLVERAVEGPPAEARRPLQEALELADGLVVREDRQVAAAAPVP